MSSTSQRKHLPYILPNVQKTANIQALREEWACTKSESACSGTYCFVNPTTSEHVPLSHEAMDAWAMGMVSTVLIISFSTYNGTCEVEPKRCSHASFTSEQQVI